VFLIVHIITLTVMTFGLPVILID
jgi:hypothetical protein